MARWIRTIGLGAVMAVLSSGCVYFARVSTDADGRQLSAGVWATDVSADGRFIVFHTDAAVVADDTNGLTDVYRKDTLTGAVVLVSASAGVPGDGASESARISDDGRWIAFQSDATNLIAGDTNGMRDVFLHDAVAGTQQRASVSTTGAQGFSASQRPDISGDGLFVVFDSPAPFDPSDANNASDVYRFDRLAGTTEIVSATGAGVVGNSTSYDASIDTDGSTVAFSSWANNLVANDTNGDQDVFARLATGAVVRVSVDASGAQGDGWSGEPSISGNGLVIAFSSGSANLVPADQNGVMDVFVKTVGGPIFLASVADDGVTQGTRVSQVPRLNGDGTIVAFQTQAREIHGGPTIDSRPVVRDGVDGRTVTVGEAAPGGAQAGYEPVVSADGRYVLYASDSTLLVTPDGNGTARDAFLAWWSIPEVTSISPTPISLGATQPVTIHGEGFSRFATVDLYTHKWVDQHIDFSNIVVVDDTTITADVQTTVGFTDLGSYTLWVEQAGGGPGATSGAAVKCADCLIVAL